MGRGNHATRHAYALKWPCLSDQLAHRPPLFVEASLKQDQVEVGEAGIQLF